MPGTTASLALRYPSPGDAPDGSGAIANLAADVETKLGQADLISSTPYNGTVINLGTGRNSTLTKQGRLAVLSLMINVGSGGLAADSLLMTLPTAARPLQEVHGIIAVFNGNGSNAFTGFADIQIATNGAVTFKFATGGNGANSQLLGSIPFATAS